MAQKKYSERKREERESKSGEVTGVVLIIISAFLLLCLLVGKYVLGDIGGAIANLTMGMFGYCAYPLLIGILVYGILKVRRRSLSVPAFYAVCAVVIAACVLIIAHTAVSSAYFADGFGGYLYDVYSRASVGGAVTGVFAYLFYATIKPVFTYILLSLAILVTLFFMLGFHEKAWIFKKRGTGKKSTPVYVDSAMNEFSGQGSTGGGLYVGTIMRPDDGYSMSDRFDDLPPDEPPMPMPEPEYGSEMQEAAEPEEDRRARARRILFSDNNEAFDKYMPGKVTSAPDVRYSSSSVSSLPPLPPLPSDPAPVIPEVPIPPKKYFEGDFVEGEIINGDELSARIGNAARNESAPAPAPAAPIAPIQNGSAGYVAPAAPASDQSEESAPEPREFKQSPIINGDTYGKTRPAAATQPEQVQPAARNESAPAPAPAAPIAPIQNGSAEYVAPAAPEPAASDRTEEYHGYTAPDGYRPYFNPGPIINGDFFEAGKKPPLVKMYSDETEKPAAPAQPTPSQPAPAQAAPVQTATPVQPTPATPVHPIAPENIYVAPKPVEPAPAPVQTAPVTPAQPAPVTPVTPVQPAPAAPVEPKPVEPVPVRPVPLTPVEHEPAETAPEPEEAKEAEPEVEESVYNAISDESDLDRITREIMSDYNNLVDELENESTDFDTEAPEDYEAASPEESEEEAEEPETEELPEQSETAEPTEETEVSYYAESESGDEQPQEQSQESEEPAREETELPPAEETPGEPSAAEEQSRESETAESGETELSRKFESTTKSFIISDEVEDLSERSYSNPNDTTGYYNQVTAPVPVSPVPAPPVSSFDSRAEKLDEKINGRPSAAEELPKEDNIDYSAEEHAAEEKAPEQRKEQPAAEKEPEKEEKKEEVPPPPPKPKKPPKYHAPPLELLVTESTHPDISDEDRQQKVDILEEALEKLGVPATVNGVTVGPAITRYELDMPPGMSVRKIEPLAADIRFNLACKGLIRIESPIPGKRAVGIEVPNDEVYTVALKDIIGSKEFMQSPSPLTIALGKDIQGNIMVTRLEKMPHLLIAGTTGSGKSSCLNSLLISLLYKASPSDVRIILIDPKQVEFTAYNGVPHMMMPNAITDVVQAINAFKWAYNEMEARYTQLREHQVRDILEFNSSPEVKEGLVPKMPFIVLIVDEFANLITSSPANRKTLEELIMAVAAKARAAGIHLVLATQRPSVDVITGTIKANLPSRIAFAVANAQNSRIILDYQGAEALLGRGDMLFSPIGESDPVRIQGAYVENSEVKSIVTYVKEHNPVDFDGSFESAIKPKEPESDDDEDDDEDSRYDKELVDVVRCVIRSGKATTSMIQRRFRFGFNRAARIIEQMEELHFIGPLNGTAPREIYVTKEKFEEYFGVPYEE